MPTCTTSPPVRDLACVVAASQDRSSEQVARVGRVGDWWRGLEWPWHSRLYFMV